MQDDPGGCRFTTLFDEVPPTFPVPGVITSGRAPQILVHDGLSLGNGNVGRFQRSIGMLGVKPRTPDDTAYVRLKLRSDRASRDYLPEPSGRDAGAPLRLMLIRAQDRLRSAVLLRPRSRGSAHVGFGITADEVPDGELLVLEASGVDHGEVELPGRLLGLIANTGPTGIKIKELGLHDRPEPPLPVGPIGRRRAERLGLVSGGAQGLFTVNPHPRLGGSDLRLGFRPALPRRLPGVVQRMVRSLSAGLVQPPTVETIDLSTGRRERMTATRVGAGDFEIHLPGPITSPRLGVIEAVGGGHRASCYLRRVAVAAR